MVFDVSWVTLGLALLVVFLGALAQGLFGFGLALMAAPVLIYLNPNWVPGPILVTMLILSLAISWRERGAVDRRTLGVPMSGQALGVVVALGVLSWIEPRNLSLLIGAMILIAVSLSLFGLKVAPRPGSLLAAGVLSGFMGTTASIPGPPLALLHQDVSPGRLRGTLAHFFVVGNAFSLLGLTWTGRFTLSALAAGLILVPAAALGFWASTRMADHFGGSRIRQGVLLFSSLGAFGLIYRVF